MSRMKFSRLLILMLSLSLVVAYYEEESEESNEDDQESSSSDESDEDTDSEPMLQSKCANAIEYTSLTKMCCHGHLHLDKAALYCSENENLSDLDFSTRKGKIQATLRLVACFFKKKNYIKSRNKINMKQVRIDATKLDDRPKAEFMIKMYRTCDEEGRKGVKMYEDYSRARELRSDGFPSRHQVYMQIIYVCLNNYFIEKTCPYFYWFSENESVNRKCKRYAQECETLIRNVRK